MDDILGTKKELKTSTAIAHDPKTLQITGYEKITKRPKCPVVLQSLLESPMITEAVKSEMKAQYIIKYDENDSMNNPTLGPKINFMKPLADTKLNFIKRNIIPQRSTSHNDYSCRRLEIPEPELPLLPKFTNPIQVKPLIIDYTKEGFAKYLDPAATTYKLSYPHYSPSFIENGISRQDHLTFYNWHLIYKPPKRVFPGADAQVCQEGPSKKCKKRSNEYPSQTKHVPHMGLTSEAKAKYRDPKRHPHNIEIESQVKKYVVNIDPVMPASRTEAMMIGSGDRVEAYI